jgi:hypothetical protein
MPFSQHLPLQTRVPKALHLSEGGRGTGYSQAMHELALAVCQAGESNNSVIQDMRQHCLWPSLWSEIHWVLLLDNHGHVRPCRRMGYLCATVLQGNDIFLLALYRIVFPKAMAAEVNAFLYRVNYGNIHFRFYSPSQITEAEIRIGLFRKKGSMTTYQALLPINHQKHWMFWNFPYPYGIADILQQDLNDLDECGVEVQSGDHSRGKAWVGKRVSQAYPYGRDTKINLLLTISGVGDTRNRW